MDLHQYIQAHSQTELARLLGVSPTFVYQWCTGRRRIPLKTCVDIEQLTNGAVTRKDLRPDDWQEIWPELVEPA
jgi:DNA-binding transcriptional regulator YdaS (Cro superfamily)